MTQKRTGFVGMFNKGTQFFRALMLDGKQFATSIAMAIAAGAATVCEVTISVVNADGHVIPGSHVIDIWLSDAATGAGLTAVAASGAVTVKAGTGTELGVLTAKKAIRCVTKDDGTIVLSITDAANTLFYVAASLPGLNTIAVSRVLAVADYGV